MRVDGAGPPSGRCSGYFRPNSLRAVNHLMRAAASHDETRCHCRRHVGQRSAQSTPVTAIVSSRWNAQRALAARRSSIKSRSTSQYLSAERRSLSIPSASADPLSSGISCRHCVEGLLDLCRVRFDFDIRQCLRRRAASINASLS
jgi:hypothetical protein